MLVQKIEEKIEQDSIILELRKSLKSFPHPNKVYLVGGVLRDYALSAKNHDYDIVVETPQGNESLAKHLYDLGISSKPHKFKNHNIISCKIKGAQLQISTTQTDHNRTNVEDNYGDLHSDAFSRDFTINSLYLRISDLTLIDPTQLAIEDLNAKILRSAYDTEKCIMDDPLRILRAIRFSLNFDLTIDRYFAEQMHKKSMLLKELHIKRISQETIAILRLSLNRGLKQFIHFGVLHHLSPTLNHTISRALSTIPPYDLPQNTNDDEADILLSLYILWVYLHHQKHPDYSNTNSIDETIESLLSELSRIMIIRRKAQSRLKTLIKSVFYLFTDQANSLSDLSLRYMIWGIGDDWRYLSHYLKWTKDSSQEPLRYRLLIEKIDQTAHSLNKTTFPLDGNQILEHVQIHERPKIASYLFLLRLKWLTDPSQDSTALLNHLNFLKEHEAEQSICEKTFVYQKNLNWLWHWADWHDKEWI
ncbi:MAG TPA: CCA tRNA nucleotidyltransferase [Candidatus Cloacimonetes bacterium]|nr:CCA tRNA nucleotidyltransferase [Candidatus Cloacimonadota bacterium]